MKKNELELNATVKHVRDDPRKEEKPSDLPVGYSDFFLWTGRDGYNSKGYWGR